MNRREILAWLSRGMSAVVAGMIGVPGIRFLSGSTPASAETTFDFQRLKRLEDLQVDQPMLVPIMGTQRDAWVQSDQEVIGRVWLVRPKADEAGANGDKPIRAFNSTCPHMGCQIQEQTSCSGFVCPCHKATFHINGQRQTSEEGQEHNPAPRDMDDLPCRIVQDPATGDSWIEVKYQSYEIGTEQRVVRS